MTNVVDGHADSVDHGGQEGAAAPVTYPSSGYRAIDPVFKDDVMLAVGRRPSLGTWHATFSKAAKNLFFFFNFKASNPLMELPRTAVWTYVLKVTVTYSFFWAPKGGMVFWLCDYDH